jgi:hypothetical protein
VRATTEFVEYLRDLLGALGELTDGRFFGRHPFDPRKRWLCFLCANVH